MLEAHALQPQPAPRQVLRRRGLIEWLSDRLFGFDLFISYGRRDATSYVATLEAALAKAGYRCFVDHREMAVGSPLDATIGRSMRRSSVLLVVATPEALRSVHVHREIGLARKLDRDIISINVRNELQRDDDEPRRTLRQYIWIDEGQLAAVSDNTIGEINRRFENTKRNTVRNRAIGGVIALLSGLLVASVVLASVARAERDEAQRQKREAQRQQTHERIGRLTVQASALVERDPATAAEYLQQSFGLASALGEPPPADTEVVARRWMTRRLERALPGHTNNVMAVAWSDDGSLLATAGYDSVVRIWDTETWRPKRDVTVSEPVHRLAFGENDESLAVGGEYGGVFKVTVAGGVVWQWDTGHTDDHNIVNKVQSLSWYGGDLLVARNDARLVELDGYTGRPTGREWKCPRQAPSGVAIEHDVLAYACDKNINIERGSSAKPRTVELPARVVALTWWTPRHAKTPTLLAMTSRGELYQIGRAGPRLVAATDRGGRVAAFEGSTAAIAGETSIAFPDARNVSAMRRIETGSDPSDLAWDQYGDRIAFASSREQVVRVFETRPPDRTDPLEGLDLVDPWQIAFAPDGRRVIGMSSFSEVVLGDLDDKREQIVAKSECDATNAALQPPISWSRDGKLFAIAESKGDGIWVWRPAQQCGTGRRIAMGIPVTSVAFQPGSHRLVASAPDGRLRLVDLDGRAVAVAGPPLQIETAAWTSDGTWLAGGRRMFGGQIVLYRASDGLSAAVMLSSVVSHLLAYFGGDAPKPVVTSDLAWQPHSATVAVAGFRGEVGVVSARERAVSWWVDGDGTPVFAIAWHPQRPLLAVGRFDGTLRVYDAAGAMRAEFATGLDHISTVAWRPQHDSIIVGGGDWREIEYPTLETIRNRLNEHITWSKSIPRTE